jgi:hypothetical protein
MQPILSPTYSSTSLKMEAESSSKTSLTNYQSTRHHTLEDCYLQYTELFVVQVIAMPCWKKKKGLGSPGTRQWSKQLVSECV